MLMHPGKHAEAWTVGDRVLYRACVRRMELLDPSGRGAGGVGHIQLLRNLEDIVSAMQNN